MTMHTCRNAKKRRICLVEVEKTNFRVNRPAEARQTRVSQGTVDEDPLG